MENKNISRSEYVMRNTTVTMIMQIVKNLLAFIGRTIFIRVLGSEYLGVNSLFTDVLTMLSFAELGIGSAMVFSLYKPIAENNTDKIKSLMRLYEKSYRIIGVVIGGLGLCVAPFINLIVGDVAYVNENITVLYLLYLLNTVLSYFFVYKKSLIIAYQKNYIVEIYQQVCYAIQIIAQSVFLVVTKQFITYLVIMIVATFLNNYFVARKADKMYPFLKGKDAAKLEKKEFSEIVSNVKALVVYKIGSILIDSTDSIFISAFINVTTVGLYANYKMVINLFKTIGGNIMNSIIASVGNLNAMADCDKQHSVFKEMFYVCCWFYGFATVGMCAFLTPFINVWLGKGYDLAFSAVLAACILFYLSSMHYPCYTFRTTAGLFIFGRYVPAIGAAINIFLDFILGYRYGLVGILWASNITRILTYELIDPIIIYKRIFKRNVISYFIMYALFACIVAVDGFISYLLVKMIPLSGIIGFCVKVIVFSIVYNGIFFAVTCRTKEFKSIFNRVKNIIKR